MKQSKDFNLLKRIDYGVKKGIAQALIEHKQKKFPIVVFVDGEVVNIPPEEIEIPDIPQNPLD